MSFLTATDRCAQKGLFTGFAPLWTRAFCHPVSSVCLLITRSSGENRRHPLRHPQILKDVPY